MTKFKVWLRPMSGVCRVKVEGSDNAEWLRKQLREQGLACSKVTDVPDAPNYGFHVVYTDAMPRAKLEESLASLAEVELQNDPA